MLKAWLIYGKEDAKRNRSFIKMHQEKGKELDMEIELIYAEDLSITVEQGKHSLRLQGKTAEKPDFVLCRTRDYLLTRQFELMQIPVFNNSEVSLVGNNKALAYQEAAMLSIPVVTTCFCRQEYLKERLFMALAGEDGALEQPLVIKSVSGHGGSQVFLYENKNQLEEILSGMGKEDAVIQPLVSAGRRFAGLYYRKPDSGMCVKESQGRL